MKKSEKKIAVRSSEMSIGLVLDIKPVLFLGASYAKIRDTHYKLKNIQQFLKKAQKVVPEKFEDLDLMLRVLEACTDCKGELLTIQPFLTSDTIDQYIFSFVFPSADAMKSFDEKITAMNSSV